MSRRRRLDEFPSLGIGWCFAPETVEQHPLCDVIACTETPEYEVYFVPDPNSYWYYMCCTHKDYFVTKELAPTPKPGLCHGRPVR